MAGCDILFLQGMRIAIIWEEWEQEVGNKCWEEGKGYLYPQIGTCLSIL